MALAFKVAQHDLGFQADFSTPMFELFRDSWGLQGQLFTRLSRHGVRLTDIRPDRGNQSLGDYSLLCYLFNFLVTVRIRLERVEIMCVDLSRVDGTKLNEAGVDVLEAVKAHVPGISFKAYTLAMGLHGTLDGMSAQEFLSRFVTVAPKNLGPPIGSGVVFYYGPEGERLLSSVTVDLSALISGGLYIRAQVVWDGSKVAIQALPAMGDKHVREVLAQLGLTAGGE